MVDRQRHACHEKRPTLATGLVWALRQALGPCPNRGYRRAARGNTPGLLTGIACGVTYSIMSTPLTDGNRQPHQTCSREIAGNAFSIFRPFRYRPRNPAHRRAADARHPCRSLAPGRSSAHGPQRTVLSAQSSPHGPRASGRLSRQRWAKCSPTLRPPTGLALSHWITGTVLTTLVAGGMMPGYV